MKYRFFERAKCAEKENSMFDVVVKYEKNWSDEETREVKEMYAKTRNYGKVCEHFSDFGLCDDAMLAWAVELGWDVDSAIAETQEILSNVLYVDEKPRYNFFYEIVNDAISYIDKHLDAEKCKQLNTEE